MSIAEINKYLTNQFISSHEDVPNDECIAEAIHVARLARKGYIKLDDVLRVLRKYHSEKINPKLYEEIKELVKERKE